MAVLDRLPALTPARYRRITSAALWSLVFIVVTGAAVRLTGSGLGCSDWPGCEPGQLTPRGASAVSPWIEFVNRLVTGAVSVAVGLAVLGSRRRTPRRRDLTRLSWGLVAGVIGQILLGALVVKLQVHPIVVQGHFVLSAVLVANAVVLHHRASVPDVVEHDGTVGREPATPLVAGRDLILARVVTAGAGVVMLAGTVVTGAGPHAGDETAARLSLAVRTAAQIHSGATWVFLAGVVALVLTLRRVGVRREAMDAATGLLSVVVLQGAIGYVQYFTGVPALLVGLHVLGAMLLWMAALRLLLALTEPLPVSAPAAARRLASAPAIS